MKLTIPLSYLIILPTLCLCLYAALTHRAVDEHRRDAARECGPLCVARALAKLPRPVTTDMSVKHN